MARRQIGFYERITLHGLYDVYTTNSWPLKAFWAVAFFAAATAAIYGCTAVVIEYIRAPVVVTYIVQESKFMQLPDLVICPFNRLDRISLREYNVSDEIAQYIEASFSGLEYLDYQRVWNERMSNNSEILENQLNAILNRTKMTFEQFFEAVSLRCSSLIEYCLNTGRQYDCCDTAVPVRTLVGKCFRIRGINQVVAGFGFGLTVKIVLPLERYQPAFNNFHNFGAMIKFAEEGKGIGYDLHFLPAGSHVLLPLLPTKYEFLHDAQRYSCTEVGENSNYSSLRCFENCLGEVGYNACNCQLIAGSSQRNLAPCTWHKLKSCFFPALKNITFEDVRSCRMQCKTPCAFWDFGASLSYTHFPAPTIERFITNKKKLAELRHTIILDVFYEKLGFTKIKHFQSMTIDTFVANIGGQLGLWIGGSILSILQLIVFALQFVQKKLKGGERSGKIQLQNGDTTNKTVQYSSRDSLIIANNEQTTYGTETILAADSLINHSLRQQSSDCCRSRSAINPQFRFCSTT